MDQKRVNWKKIAHEENMSLVLKEFVGGFFLVAIFKSGEGREGDGTRAKVLQGNCAAMKREGERTPKAGEFASSRKRNRVRKNRLEKKMRFHVTKLKRFTHKDSRGLTECETPSSLLIAF